MESNEHKITNKSNESMNSNEPMDHKDSNELNDHKELKETNLDLLIKIIDKDKYYKRKREDKFEESNFTNFLIDSDEESEIELETKGSLLDKDIFNTFNEDYETYLRSNSDLESEILFDHPLFSSYKLKNVTPLVKYLLSLREVPNPLTNHSEYHINTLISKRINTLLKSKKIDIPELSSSIKYFFTCLNTYVDVFYLNNRIGTLDSIRFIYSLHIANHITKSSSTKSSSTKSSLNKSSMNKCTLNKSTLNKSSRNEESDVDERTEGFTRPKVLVICGLRCIAKDIITNLLKIIPTSKSNKNLERFEMEFSLSDEDLKEQNESYLKTKKAKDYVMTFSGNQDDAFKIGIRYESGLLNLYTPFYSSDIIIASPLGLRPLINVFIS
uniref:UTP25 NTP hydrolase-like domain-containing protein n=1 Tax=Theileria annulata TaxID=5874 RepID=A0A3B0MKB2_THEAN